MKKLYQNSYLKSSQYHKPPRLLIDINRRSVYNLGMRRNDREVKDISDIISIMRRCDVCRIALNDGAVPYIVPLNFGMSENGGKITLFFHSATEGKKLDLMRRSDAVCFEMDHGHRLYSDAEKGYCTMEYESVIGYGRIRFIENYEEKICALQSIVDKYHPGGFEFGRAAVDRTAVYSLEVQSVTGKARKKER